MQVRERERKGVSPLEYRDRSVVVGIPRPRKEEIANDRIREREREEEVKK